MISDFIRVNMNVTNNLPIPDFLDTQAYYSLMHLVENDAKKYIINNIAEGAF